MKVVFFYATVLLIVVTNYLWRNIKDLLRQNGYRTNRLWSRGNEIANLRRLIGREQDAGRKRSYQFLFVAFYVMLPLMIISFLLSVFWPT